MHVMKHSICFVSVKCSGPVLPYSAFIFVFSDTSVTFFSQRSLNSQKVSKEAWCFSSKNQEPVFLCLKDIKNRVNKGLMCKLSYSVLAAKAEFTSVQRSRSFHHLEMKMFSSWEQRAGIPQNVTIFHQLISLIVFVLINFSLWSVMHKLKSLYWDILQCCSTLLQGFAL